MVILGSKHGPGAVADPHVIHKHEAERANWEQPGLLKP